jgi:hypothetical protein
MSLLFFLDLSCVVFSSGYLFRITKYPLLIEPLIKTAKERPEEQQQLRDAHTPPLTPNICWPQSTYLLNYLERAP